jgi:DNA-binding CsgD family transcriptional regulator
VLDQIDHGILVLRGDDTVLVANRVARLECGQHPALQCQANRLTAHRRTDADRLQRALQGARRGMRTLLVFATTNKAGVAATAADPPVALPLPLVLLPLQALDGPTAQPLVLALFAKRHGSEPLNVDLFAQAHHLTATECAVLKGLSAGLAPSELARQHGVALSTLRTQIGSIRSKTQTRSIREMLGLVHNLPPVMGSVVGLLPTAVAPASKPSLAHLLPAAPTLALRRLTTRQPNSSATTAA